MLWCLNHAFIGIILILGIGNSPRIVNNYGGNEKVEITKREFKAYVKVQMSGVTNMFYIKNVEHLSGLTRERIIDIMENYEVLQKKYPEVK